MSSNFNSYHIYSIWITLSTFTFFVFNNDNESSYYEKILYQSFKLHNNRDVWMMLEWQKNLQYSSSWTVQGVWCYNFHQWFFSTYTSIERTSPVCLVNEAKRISMKKRIQDGLPHSVWCANILWNWNATIDTIKLQISQC